MIDDLSLTIVFPIVNESDEERVRKLVILVQNQQKIQDKINEIIPLL